MFGLGQKYDLPPPASADAAGVAERAECAIVEADVGKEWEIEIDAEAPDLQLAERILSQDEIDSLLGFGRGQEELARPTGVRAIANATFMSGERLPMLEIVFARLARLMSTSLGNFIAANVEVSLDQIASIGFADYLDAIPLPAAIAVFRTERLDDFGVAIVDSSLIQSVVELSGRRRGGAPWRVEGRRCAALERVLVTRMIDVVLADVRQAFAPLTVMNFKLDRIETDPRFVAGARPPIAAIAVKLRVDMEDRGGLIELVLPPAALEPIRKQLTCGNSGRDSIWEGRLASELSAARLEVRAVLDELKQPLRKVLDLEVGDTLMLDARLGAQVNLKCGDVNLAVGRVGRMGHSLAVRVEQPIAPAPQRALMKRGGDS